MLSSSPRWLPVKWGCVATASLARDRPGQRQVQLAGQRACGNTGEQVERHPVELERECRRCATHPTLANPQPQPVPQSGVTKTQTKLRERSCQRGVVKTPRAVESLQHGMWSIRGRFRGAESPALPRSGSQRHGYSESACTNGSLHFSSVRILRSVSVFKNATRATLGTSGRAIPLAAKSVSLPSRFG